jgi:hypothetical protein
VDWGHNQGFGDAARVTLAYADSSDGQVRREYQQSTEYRPYRSYQGSLTDQEDWGSLALTVQRDADFRDESLYATGESFTDLAQRPQLLPRLTYRSGGRPWADLPLGLGFSASATRFLAREAVSGQVATASPSLSLPIALGGAFELRPTITRHFVSYQGLRVYSADAGEQQPQPDQSFAQTEGEVELRGSFARIYSSDGGAAGALKHRLTPRLIYRQVQDVAQPLTDQVLRARPTLQLLTLRLDNSLLGRGAAPAGTEGPPPASERVRFDLIQRYNLLYEKKEFAGVGPPLPSPQETEPGQPLLPLILDVAVNGAGYSLGVNLHFHHQLGRFTEYGLGANATLRPHTTLGVSYHLNEFTYFTPDNRLVAAANDLGLSGETALTDRLSFGFSGVVDLRDVAVPLDRRLSSYGLFLDFHTICYRVNISYQETVGSTVEAGETRYFLDHSARITFDLSSLVGGRALSLNP